MDHTNAERQRRYIERLKAQASGATSKDAQAEIAALKAEIAALKARPQLAAVSNARAEPQITPDMLSMTAQQKLETAIRQHRRELGLQYRRDVSEAVRKHMDEILLPDLKAQITQADGLYKARKTLMDKATFNRIRRALHPDSRHAASDKVLAEAFDAFMGLEKYLLDEKDSPTTWSKLPDNLAEWDKMRARATAERRSKHRGHKQAPVRR